MKYQILKGKKFGWEGVKGWNIFLGKKASIHYIEIDANIPKRRSLGCDRTYFILHGKAEFIVSGKRVIVNEKEAIRIPKNTVYAYKPLKTIRLVEVNFPPYDDKYEIEVN